MNKNLMKQMGFTKEVERVENSRCPLCNKKINKETEFKNDLSKREFDISGLCQTCQDKSFD